MTVPQATKPVERPAFEEYAPGSSNKAPQLGIFAQGRNVEQNVVALKMLFARGNGKIPVNGRGARASQSGDRTFHDLVVAIQPECR